jgi:hypothetical protein
MKTLRFFLFFIIVSLMSPFAAGFPQSTEWTLRITVEKASVRQAPRPAGAVVITLAKGTTIQSYEKTGDWFRVVIAGDKGGLTAVGYVFSGDVEILEEKTAKERDFWAEAPEDVRIRGISLKIGGGLAHFSGGDMKGGVQGIWDEKAASLLAQGYILEGGLEPFKQSFEFSADVIFRVLPNLGIGLGSGYIYGTRHSGLYFNSVEETWRIYEMAAKPSVRAVPIRLGLYYSLPVHKLLSISASGGAALYRVKYELSMSSDSQAVDGLYHEASTSGLGFFGSLGLEMKLERRAFLFLECRARQAEFSGFTGTETVVKLFLPPNSMPYDETSKTEGTLYYLENGGSRMAVFKDKPDFDGTAREAVFNLSGFGIRVGLKFTF